MPYHVVPPSVVKNTQMSTAFAVVVRDSADAPPGNLNEPPAQATVLPAVPSFGNIKVMEVEEPEPTGEDNVIVALPVRVAVNTLPFVQVSVRAVPVLPAATTVSAYAVGRT